MAQPIQMSRHFGKLGAMSGHVCVGQGTSRPSLEAGDEIGLLSGKVDLDVQGVLIAGDQARQLVEAIWMNIRPFGRLLLHAPLLRRQLVELGSYLGRQRLCDLIDTEKSRIVRRPLGLALRRRRRPVSGTLTFTLAAPRQNSRRRHGGHRRPSSQIHSYASPHNWLI